MDTPFAEFGAALSADGDCIAAVAGGPTMPWTVIRVEATTGKTEVLHCDNAELPGAGYLPVPQHMDFEGPYGQVVHALLYPPTNPDAGGRMASGRRTSCGYTAGRPAGSRRCST